MPKRKWKKNANAYLRLADEWERCGNKDAAKRFRAKANELKNHRGRKPKGGRTDA